MEKGILRGILVLELLKKNISLNGFLVEQNIFFNMFVITALLKKKKTHTHTMHSMITKIVSILKSLERCKTERFK